MSYKSLRGTPFAAVTASGTGVVTATVSANAGQTAYITDLSVGTDKSNGTFTVIANGSIIYQQRITNNQPFDVDFQEELSGGAGNNITVTTTGTSSCFVNVSGFTVP